MGCRNWFALCFNTPFLISFTTLFISFIIFITCLQRIQNIITSPIEQSRTCRRGELVLCHEKIAYALEKITYEHITGVCSAIAEITHTSDALVIRLLVFKSSADWKGIRWNSNLHQGAQYEMGTNNPTVKSNNSSTCKPGMFSLCAWHFFLLYA